MKKLIYIPLLFCLVLVGYFFHLKNPQSVDISFLGFEWSGSISILIVISILFGVILGSLAMAFQFIKAKTAARSAKKKLVKAEKEVENLRALPIKDNL